MSKVLNYSNFNFKNQTSKYEGKVRDVYTLRGNTLVMIASDRISAFDVVMPRGIIEIAPLAYMRGRTLDDAFVILDEAQNTTKNQMKMFLTRMGKKAKFMITGDPGQIDLPKLSLSGLKTANNILQKIEGIEIVYLDGSDVIRHKLVTSIIDAYDKNENI